MAQPSSYQRTKDFGADYPDQTDNQAINNEFDNVAQSIGGLRTNLAKIQRDDGGLADGVVTKDALAQPLKQELYDEFSANVTSAVLTAQQAAGDANTAAIAAGNSATSASDSAAAAALSETASATSESAASASATAAQNSATAAASSASAALTSETQAANYAVSAATSETNAGDSATTASAAEAAAISARDAAALSAQAAATSETNAATSESNAGTSAADASAAAVAAANSESAAAGYLAAIETPFRLVKTYDGPCIIKTGPAAASIRAGTYVSVADVYKQLAADTAITMPGVMTSGEDYSVWAHPDGTVSAVVDSYASPAAAPVPGAVRFSGFHYGLVAPGTTVASGGFSTSGVTSSGGSMAWTQTDVDKIAGINEFSIWDLTFRCAGEQRGMAFDPISQCWVAIYLMSTDSDANGPSRYNTDVASGTVLPKIPAAWGGNGTLAYAALRSWEANEMVTAYGLRLIRYEEFVSAAFGVTEGQSLGGSSVTIPATARQPNYTSRIGLEQATGNAWIIGGPINSSNGTAWAGNGRGSWFGTTGLVLLGGDRDGAANSGSRAAHFNSALSYSAWPISVRAAGDHLSLGRTAR